MAQNWATHMEDGLRNLFRGFLDYCTVHMQLAECRIAVVMAFATFCLARLLFPISLSPYLIVRQVFDILIYLLMVRLDVAECGF
jgi:hypothetical protein